MFYIAICDDFKKTADKLQTIVSKFLEKHNELAEIKVYTQSNLLMYDVKEGKHFDLILSDIEMPEIDGLELAKVVKKYLPEVYLIFITSHTKYAIDSFELSVFRYIPKDQPQKLNQGLKDVFNLLHLQEDQYYTISMPSRMEKIAYHRIVYIEKSNKNAILHLMDQTQTQVRKSIIKVYEELHSEDFIYIDRSTIVNMAHITAVRDRKIEMEDGSVLNPSYTRLDEIKQTLNQYWSNIVCN